MGVYDPASGSPLTSYLGHEAAVRDGAFSHDGRRAATTGLDGGVRIWDPESGKEQLVLGQPSNSGDLFRALAWSPDDSLLAAGGGSDYSDYSVRIYQTRDGKELRRLRGHSDQVYRLAFSPDGTRLASTGRDATVKIWDVNSGDELLTLRDHSSEVYDLAFSRDGRFLASAGLDRIVRARSAGPAAAPSTQDWPVVVRDEFDRPDLGDRWKILRGRWSIENGAARGLLEPRPGSSPSYQAAAIAPRNLCLPSTADVRFECWSPRDIHVEARFHETDRVGTGSAVGLLFMGVGSLRDPGNLATSIRVIVDSRFVPVLSNPRELF